MGQSTVFILEQLFGFKRWPVRSDGLFVAMHTAL